MAEAIKNFIGALKDPHTLEEISKKHGVSVESLTAEVELGLKEEKEHTADEATAGVIVLHHLWGKPNYYSSGEFKNSGESAWPKAYKARHLEPGLVRYSDLGDVDPATNKPKGMTLLLTKEAIDSMRPTFKGKPVVNWYHKPVKPEDFKKGSADGIITGAYHNPTDGWDWVEFLVWDEGTKQNCDKGFQLSCAYVPTEVKVQPGMYHNIPYDGEVISGTYTHMAIVKDPRYERSLIMCNSLGGKMKKLLLKLIGKTEPVELDNSTEIEIDGKKISLEALVNAFKAEQAEKEKAALENSIKEIKDDTLIKVDGVEVSVKDLKEAHSAHTARLNAMAEADEKAKKEKEEAEAKNAADEAEKKKKDDEAAEAEKKNAAEQAAKDEADKKAAETEKKNAAYKAFQDLKNAKDKGGNMKPMPEFENETDKLARGKSKYGATVAPETK
jgi:hypothetical protein